MGMATELLSRAFALTVKSFEAHRSEEERSDLRLEAWELLSHIATD